MSLPGRRLHVLAARVCSEKTMKQLIDPVLADLQVEHASAIGMRGRWLALLSGYVAFVKVMLWCGALGTREAWRDWTADDQRALNRTLLCVAGATVFATSLFGLPDLFHLPDMLSINAHARLERLLLYLVPSAVALGLPAGVAIGAALGATKRAQSRRVITAMCFVALLLSIASFVNIAWVVPHAHQSFRVELVGRFPERGINELTLTELRKLPRGAFLFHVRLALAVAPLTFAIFGVVAATRRWRRSVAVTVVCTAVVSFVVALKLGGSLSEQEFLPPQVAAWLPLFLFAYATILIGWLVDGRQLHPNARES